MGVDQAMDVDVPVEVVADAEHPDYERAMVVIGRDPEAALGMLQLVLDDKDEECIYAKAKEAAVYRIGEIHTRANQPDALGKLLVKSRAFFDTLPKARTAKIVRTLLDMVGKIPNSLPMQINLCRESIAWCVEEKRGFLKQRLESRLASLLLEQGDFKAALALIALLSREVKKIDDKLLLVEIMLVESRIHLALKNVPRSKASLTSARANANSIYCPPALQAQIDNLGGVLCAEEKDFETSFSYFYEAFEAYNTSNNPDQAVKMLKYMLLAKIMLNKPSEVFGIISGKSGVRFAGVELEAMRAVANAYKGRSLHELEAALDKYPDQLRSDVIIQSQLSNLYEMLLEQNLLRIIEPFSRVQVAHIAKLIDLPLARVQTKYFITLSWS